MQEQEYNHVLRGLGKVWSAIGGVIPPVILSSIFRLLSFPLPSLPHLNHIFFFLPSFLAEIEPKSHHTRPTARVSFSHNSHSHVSVSDARMTVWRCLPLLQNYK